MKKALAVLVSLAAFGGTLASVAAAEAAQSTEIGRASGRERVLMPV